MPGLPYLRAEAIFAVRHEMAQSVDDVLSSRRTRPACYGRADGRRRPDEVAEPIFASSAGCGRDRHVGRRVRATLRARARRSRLARGPPSSTCAHGVTMELGPAPPPPTGARGRSVRGHGLLDGAVAVPADAGPPAAVSAVTVDASERAEASRDWYSIAMVWALDDQVGGLAPAVCRPT